MRREIKAGLLVDHPIEKSSKDFGVDLKKMSVESVVSKQDTLLRELIQEFAQAKKRLRENENRLSVTEQRLAQLVRGTKGRMDKVQTTMTGLAEQIQLRGQETRTQISLMAGKIREQNASDQKIQQLIERHHQIVQSFETRIHQMQKLISDQEFKILNYQATLDETRRELEILKRL